MTMDFHTKMLEQLYEYALEDRGYKRYRLAAALVLKKKILAIGWNSYQKSHPLQKKFSQQDGRVFLHAEIDAIRRYRRFLDRDRQGMPDGLVIYVCHAGKEGWRPAKPCPGCMGALTYFGIDHVIYSNLGTGNYTCRLLGEMDYVYEK